MASQLPEDAWAGEWREFVSHAGNPCGSPSPVLRRRVQNSITGAAKISLPGLQNGLLEVSAEIVAGRLCGPPSEAAREFPGGHFGVLLQRTLEACETINMVQKVNMLGAP